MPGGTSIRESTNPSSSIFESSNYDSQSKTTTAKTEQQQRRITYRLPSIRSELMISSQKTRQDKKSKGYLAPVSDRESWWRVTIKDTPNPGTYDTHLNTFIKEVVARPMTYGFKSDGRRRDPQPLEPKGKELLPGAYKVEDFSDRISRLQISYGFKGPERDNLLKQTLQTNQDRDIDVAPGLYETQKYHSIKATVEPAKHSFFKSTTNRRIFLPKLGPAPGDYEPETTLINTKSPTITSSFRSRTDRFPTKVKNTPGPGTYTSLTDFPKLKQLDTYSTRGIYFNANFLPMASTVI